MAKGTTSRMQATEAFDGVEGQLLQDLQKWVSTISYCPKTFYLRVFGPK